MMFYLFITDIKMINDTNSENYLCIHYKDV